MTTFHTVPRGHLLLQLAQAILHATELHHAEPLCYFRVMLVTIHAWLVGGAKYLDGLCPCAWVSTGDGPGSFDLRSEGETATVPW